MVRGSGYCVDFVIGLSLHSSYLYRKVITIIRLPLWIKILQILNSSCDLFECIILGIYVYACQSHFVIEKESIISYPELHCVYHSLTR
jgi:hypothetical protein